MAQPEQNTMDRHTFNSKQINKEKNIYTGASFQKTSIDSFLSKHYQVIYLHLCIN